MGLEFKEIKIKPKKWFVANCKRDKHRDYIYGEDVLSKRYEGLFGKNIDVFEKNGVYMYRNAYFFHLEPIIFDWMIDYSEEPCKYCISKSGEYDDVDYINYDEDDYHFIKMEEDCIIVDCKDAIDTVFFVNYCPICGRKLKTE